MKSLLRFLPLLFPLAAQAAGAHYEQAIQKYQQYLNRFPQGRHASNAKDLVEVTLPRQIDDQSWRSTTAAVEAAREDHEEAIQKYRQYLDRFPQGQHASNAKELVNVTLPRQIDDQAWKSTTTAAEGAGSSYEFAIQQYEQYLRRFPQGRHISDAMALVDVTLPHRIAERNREHDYQTAVRDASTEFQLKNWFNADQAIRRALEIKPDSAESVQLKEMQQTVAHALFDAQVVSFNKAIESKAIGTASEILTQATAILPDDPSLEFEEGSKSLGMLLSDGQLQEAKAELGKLKALNIESDKWVGLDRKISLAIEKTISSAVLRGRAALQSNNIAEANEALGAALAVDPMNPSVLALQSEIKDFAYKRAMIEALNYVNAGSFTTALDIINRVLIDRPDDSTALQVKNIVGELNSLPQAIEFNPDEAIAAASASRQGWYRPDNFMFTARITSYQNQGNGYGTPAIVYAEKINLFGVSYTLCIDLRDPQNQWTTPAIAPPAVGATVLVYGQGCRVDLRPVGGTRQVAPIAPQWSNALRKYGISITANAPAASVPEIWTRAIVILPDDYISSRKKALATVAQAMSPH